VFVPIDPVETYYFSSLKHPPGDFMGLPEGLSPDLAWYLRFFQESPAAIAARQAQCQRQFGTDYARRIAGEATATYALGIDREILADILLLRPDLKVILTLRNPMHRTWSNAKLELATRHGCSITEVDPQLVQRFVSDPYHRRCGDHDALVGFWGQHLRPGHLLVRSFEQATADPIADLRAICRFLGVSDSRDLVPRTVADRVNATDDAPIPDRYVGLMNSLFQDQVIQLRRLGFVQ
jgi:hypothetical protein